MIDAQHPPAVVTQMAAPVALLAELSRLLAVPVVSPRLKRPAGARVAWLGGYSPSAAAFLRLDGPELDVGARSGVELLVGVLYMRGADQVPDDSASAAVEAVGGDDAHVGYGVERKVSGEKWGCG